MENYGYFGPLVLIDFPLALLEVILEGKTCQMSLHFQGNFQLQNKISGNTWGVTDLPGQEKKSLNLSGPMLHEQVYWNYFS